MRRSSEIEDNIKNNNTIISEEFSLEDGARGRLSEETTIGRGNLAVIAETKQENVCDKAVQFDGDTIFPSFLLLIRSDVILNSLTGIQSLKILDEITRIITRRYHKLTKKYSTHLTVKERIL